MLVVFRTDASLEMGTGHVMRCLTLAQALRARGADCRFVTRMQPGNLANRIQDAGFDVARLPAPQGQPPDGPPVHAPWAGVAWAQDAADTIAALEDRQPDWLVVDHYAFDARWERAVAAHVGRVFAWDDLADRPHACDLLLDQNLGRDPEAYAALLPEGTPVLAGPRYAVLRPEFAELRPAALASRSGGPLRRIMVSLGGVDRPNATGAVLEVLAGVPGLRDVQVDVILGSRAPAVEEVRKQAATMPMRVDVAVDVDDMARRMARADLAIGAVGGTTWERCALGLPSLLLTIADNQRPAARALHESGAAYLLGDLADADWRNRLAEWLIDPARDARLSHMAASAARLCDGEGANRVLEALERPAWTFREAHGSDARAVYDWRYGSGPDPFAQAPEVPDYGDHAAWFTKALSDESRKIGILEVDGTPAGYIRLDRADDRATVSLCLSPDARGKGWGGVLLAKAALMAQDAGLAGLDAWVHRDNAASLRLFEAAGYRRTGRDGSFDVFTRRIGVRT